MNDWTDGYVAEVNYPYGYYRELNPTFQSFVQLVHGYEGVTSYNQLQYCELGCGQGVTTNLLAASNPHIKFYATDFNPSQIVGAEKLARQAGLENIHFYDSSFEDFLSEPTLPRKFDVICLHGIYSWVSERNRSLIIEFIKSRLQPGGVVYISYNALPGWSVAMPLRQLFAEFKKNVAGPIHSRLTASIDFVESVQQAKARYFSSNPSLTGRLDQLRVQDKDYLSHEYLNKDWTPFYITDVDSDLSAAKLSFSASAEPLSYVLAHTLTDEQKNIVDSLPNIVQKELIKDYIFNNQFRKDLFVKGIIKLGSIDERDFWLNQRIVLIRPKEDIAMSVGTQFGELALRKEIYEPLIKSLPNGPILVKDILKNPEVARLSWNNIKQALSILFGAGHIEPCLPLKNEEKRLKSTRILNYAIIQRAKQNADIQFLASPVTGGGIFVARFDQLFLLAIAEGLKTSSDWARFVWNILKAEDQRLRRNGIVLTADEENLNELNEQAFQFAGKTLPVLKWLQIV